MSYVADNKVFEQQEIEVLEQISFQSKEEQIRLLSVLSKLKKNSITIPYINNDLVKIFLEINSDDSSIIKKVKETNWEDFSTLFKHKESERKKRIYDNFIEFLRSELGIATYEKPLIEKSLLEDIEVKTKKRTFNKEIFELKPDFDVEKDLYNKCKKFDVIVDFDYTEPSKKISVNDFTLYFNRRLQYFTDLLSSRMEMDEVLRINQLTDLFESNTQVDIIGLISEISVTKNGHFMITIEDKSGQISCFVNKDKTELVKVVEHFCLDEGIGVKGKVGKNIIWVDEFIIPSPPNSTELKRTDDEHYVAFLSDLHFGAKVFVDEAFEKFLEWINGETKDDKLNDLARKIKYVIIAGDLIEGIGIYPNQGKDARILNTEGQYHETARWLSQIPKHIGIIIIPGNHGTDRLSEPQPKLPYHKAYALYNMENTIMLSNPSIVRLFKNDTFDGLSFYLYHGGSFFYYADKIKHLREKGGAKVPEEVVKFLLEKRHIAPSHGATLYIPDSQNDPLVIKKMPDFFITGHTHKLSLANYKGCTIISCGCWVEMSDYQEKMGMFPDIGKCTIVNTQTRKPKILNFYTEKYKLKEDQK